MPAESVTTTSTFAMPGSPASWTPLPFVSRKRRPLRIASPTMGSWTRFVSKASTSVEATVAWLLTNWPPMPVTRAWKRRVRFWVTPSWATRNSRRFGKTVPGSASAASVSGMNAPAFSRHSRVPGTKMALFGSGSLMVTLSAGAVPELRTTMS